jgi:hypothetical protein
MRQPGEQAPRSDPTLGRVRRYLASVLSQRLSEQSYNERLADPDNAPPGSRARRRSVFGYSGNRWPFTGRRS